MIADNEIIGNTRFDFWVREWFVEQTVSGEFSGVYTMATSLSLEGVFFAKIDVFDMEIDWMRIQRPSAQSFIVNPREDILVSSRAVTGAGGSYSFYFYNITTAFPTYSQTVSM